MRVDADYLKENSDIIQKLRQIPVLESFEEKDLQELLRLAKIWKFEPGELILTEGTHNTWLFYLVSGKVRVMKSGKELVVMQRIGDIFGEMGVIDGSVRSASVYAIDETVCLATDINLLNQKADDHRYDFRYIIFRGFAEILAHRLKETSDELFHAREEIEKLNLANRLILTTEELNRAKKEIEELKKKVE
jgi:CRP-like cAMP-binding protein